MQDLLTYAATAVLFAAPVYFVSMFALGFSSRRRRPVVQPINASRPAPQPATEEAAIVAPSKPSAVPESIAPVTPSPITDVVAPFVRPQSKSPTVGDLPNWSALSPYDLRKACQAHGIRWRNADPKTGKHLKKAAMIAALSAIATAA